MKPGGVGDEMLAGRVSLVLADGAVATQALVRAVWTDDTVMSTRIDRHVAHYTGQVELADAIQEGLHAAKAGDERTATVKLGPGRAARGGVGARGHDAAAAKVVDVDDAEHGTVRLRKGTEKAAEMTLDTRSTRTVRLGQGEASADRRGGRLMATVTCPAGHESATDDYCDTCGAPIGAAPPRRRKAAPGRGRSCGRAGGRGRGRTRGGRGARVPGLRRAGVAGSASRAATTSRRARRRLRRRHAWHWAPTAPTGSAWSAPASRRSPSSAPTLSWS